ncbi:MAG TPA: PAS domain-containing protein [Candidatus Sulfotelmatobacter sp.]|nr:PAS domain-containing protein [Candidatus Sulfotelmatobacter sp.]
MSQPEIPAEIEAEELHRLYAYWLSRRGGRRYPARRDIDPLDFRYLLGRIVLIDVLRAPLRFRIRLQGIDVVKYFRRDLTGKTFDDIARPELRAFMLHRAKQLVEAGEPHFARRELVMDDRTLRFEAAVLPLADDGATIDMVLLAIILPFFPELAGS